MIAHFPEKVNSLGAFWAFLIEKIPFLGHFLASSNQKEPQTRLFLVLITLRASEVRKCTVGFRHTVTIFLLLEGGTGFIVSINDFKL